MRRNQLLFFLLAAIDIVYTSFHRQDVTPVVEHWLEREIAYLGHELISIIGKQNMTPFLCLIKYCKGNTTSRIILEDLLFCFVFCFVLFFVGFFVVFLFFERRGGVLFVCCFIETYFRFELNGRPIAPGD